MPTWDYLCTRGHVFDGLYKFEEKVVDCLVCNGETGISTKYPPRTISLITTLIAKVHGIIGWREDEDEFIRSFVLLPVGKARRILLSMPSWMAKNANSLRIVVHRDPRTSEFSFPANTNSPIPPGMERVEITNIHQARKVEKAVSLQETAKASENFHRQREYYNSMRAEGKKEILAAIPKMSQYGREFADITLQRNHELEARKSTIVPGIDAGFNALSYDLSNREGHSDEATKWKTVRE